MAKGSKPVPVTEHDATGTVKFMGFHLAGEMHGAWESSPKDGSVMPSGEVDQGRQVGIWRTFDRSGGVVKKTAFTGDTSAASDAGLAGRTKHER